LTTAKLLGEKPAYVNEYGNEILTCIYGVEYSVDKRGGIQPLYKENGQLITCHKLGENK
jgi:hypothetical protein